MSAEGMEGAVRIARKLIGFYLLAVVAMTIVAGVGLFFRLLLWALGITG